MDAWLEANPDVWLESNPDLCFSEKDGVYKYRGVAVGEIFQDKTTPNATKYRVAQATLELAKALEDWGSVRYCKRKLAERG